AARDLLRRRRGAGRGPARNLGRPVEEGHVSETLRIGLLGRGTVGSAFDELVAERADQVEAATGRRPVVTGVLTRSQGDFGEILPDADVIVELMGGTDTAREHVLAALKA